MIFYDCTQKVPNFSTMYPKNLSVCVCCYCVGSNFTMLVSVMLVKYESVNFKLFVPRRIFVLFKFDFWGLHSLFCWYCLKYIFFVWISLDLTNFIKTQIFFRKFDLRKWFGIFAIFLIESYDILLKSLKSIIITSNTIFLLGWYEIIKSGVWWLRCRQDGCIDLWLLRPADEL